MQIKIILPLFKLLDMGDVVQEVSRQWGDISLPLSLSTLGVLRVDWCHAHTHTRKDVNM